jgi:urease accessory protein
VEAGAILEYLPDAIIPYAGSCYRQDTSIQLRRGASLYWWEIVSPGREAFGERFGYDSLRLDSRIESCGEPISVERFSVEPQDADPASPLRLGSFSHWATLYVCKAGEPRGRWLEIARELREICLTLDRADEVRWGVASLVNDGLIVRGMSRSGRHLSAGLAPLWARAKILLSGHEAVPPRKLY